MIRKVTGILLLPLFSLAGCATQGISTVHVTEPSKPAFSYEKTFDRPQGDVWDKLVKNIAKSFFVINNIDKESRIINLSYSSNRPQDYVDCGRTKRTFSEGKTNESYEYGVTDNLVTFKVAPTSQPDLRFIQVGTIIRNTSLDGRANVYVAPEKAGTVVSVNAKSIVKITTQGEILTTNLLGAVIRRDALPSGISEVTGITKGGTENTISDSTRFAKILCYSTGKLEQDILDLAN